MTVKPEARKRSPATAPVHCDGVRGLSPVLRRMIRIVIHTARVAAAGAKVSIGL